MKVTATTLPCRSLRDEPRAVLRRQAERWRRSDLGQGLRSRRGG